MTALKTDPNAPQTKGFGSPDESRSIAVEAFVYGSILDGSWKLPPVVKTN